jgi:ATP-dependent Clp protease ATP-binding subunit ClpC
MFTRFTERATKVMQLANQEAQRFNHEYIGTEHILLGLVKEGTGVGANVLKNLAIDLRKVRLEVEKIVQSGPDMVTMGKLPQTPRAKKVIEYALEEARNLNHNYVGTEHILLGPIREREGVAAQVLINLGLRLDDVRQEGMKLLGQDYWARSRDLEISGVSKKTDYSQFPAHVREELEGLDSLIETLEAKKEDCVARQDFEQAAHARDDEDRAGRGDRAKGGYTVVEKPKPGTRKHHENRHSPRGAGRTQGYPHPVAAFARHGAARSNLCNQC